MTLVSSQPGRVFLQIPRTQDRWLRVRREGRAVPGHLFQTFLQRHHPTPHLGGRPRVQEMTPGRTRAAPRRAALPPSGQRQGGAPPEPRRKEGLIRHRLKDFAPASLRRYRAMPVTSPCLPGHTSLEVSGVRAQGTEGKIPRGPCLRSLVTLHCWYPNQDGGHGGGRGGNDRAARRAPAPQAAGATLQKGTRRTWGKVWASQARPDGPAIASSPEAGMWWPREQESPRASSEWAMQRPAGALSVIRQAGKGSDTCLQNCKVFSRARSLFY